MNIAKKIEDLKQGFRRQQSLARDKKVLKSYAERRHYEDVKESNDIIAKNEAFIKQGKKEAFERRTAPLKNFAMGVKTRLAERSKARAQNNNSNSIFSSIGGGFGGSNSIYHGDSKKGGGNNIFTQGSGSNPFNFSATPTKEKVKPKTKTIIRY